MSFGPRDRLRIIQVSDCHVSASPDAVYRSLSADENLSATVRAAKRWGPDLVIVTGDLSEDGSRESYRRTAGVLEQIGAPLLVLPGNHDLAEPMSEYFPAGPWNGPHVLETAAWCLILLDSTLPGRISGQFSHQALERLEDILQSDGGKHQLVALHHQPVAVGSPWIDRYCLKSARQFLDVIDRAPGVRCMVWGHVHHAFEANRRGVCLLAAPSTAANSLPAVDTFTLDPSGPACRWLELGIEGRVLSGIVFADGPPQAAN